MFPVDELRLEASDEGELAGVPGTATERGTVGGADSGADAASEALHHPLPVGVRGVWT